MQEAQHALESGSQLIEEIVQRLQALEGAETRARAALDGARAAILAAERAVNEAQYQERSAHDKSEGQARLAVSRGARRQALASERRSVPDELGQRDASYLRDRLQ